MRSFNPDWKWLGHVALIYAGAVVAGAIAEYIGLPLPWMIGAMVFATAVRMAGAAIRVPGFTRPLGQMVVAGSVGLSFTPAAVSALGALVVPMVAAALLTVLAGFLVAMVVMRMAHIDVVSASLASVPIGPVETAVLARRHGVDPGPVVFAQTLRIMTLVLLIPPSLMALEGGVSDPSAAIRAMPWDVPGAFLLAVLAVLGAGVARLVRLSNPFFVGSLAGAALGAALALPVTAFPYAVLATAQIFLGVWLGAVFDRALLTRARGFVMAAVVSTALMIALCAAMGLGLSLLIGQPWATMVLATAPGSVTEMALTAKILQEGIAVVTAFHLVRIFIILPAAPLIFSVTARIARRYGIGPPKTPDEQDEKAL